MVLNMGNKHEGYKLKVCDTNLLLLGGAKELSKYVNYWDNEGGLCRFLSLGFRMV